MLPPLPDGIFTTGGDLGTPQGWEAMNLQGRGTMVHRWHGGSCWGSERGCCRLGWQPAQTLCPYWGPSSPSPGSLLTLAGVPPHGAESLQGGRAPAQPFLGVPPPRAAAPGAHGLVWATVGIPWKPEGISSVVTYEQQHTTSQHRDTDMLPGTPGREGDTHMPERAPLPALGQPGGRTAGERGAGPARARGDEVSLLWDENMLTYTTRPPSGGQRRF